MGKTFVLAWLLLLSSGCDSSAVPNEGPSMSANTDPSGAEYLNKLAEAIRHSDRIVLTEHSYPYDAYDSKAGKSLVPNEVVYGTREFDRGQTESFLATVEGLDPRTQNAVTACIFEPHHTLRFYAKGELVSTMGICFKCAQVKWDATDLTPPWSLLSGLSAVVKVAGFSPERDWADLAEQHLKR